MTQKLKQLWETMKKYREPIGYVVLVVLLFGACFSGVFAYLAAVFILGFAVLLHDETKIIGLILCFNLFYPIFGDKLFNLVGLTTVVMYSLKSLVCLLYVIRVLKKELKFNFKILIPIGLFLIYVILPMHQWTIRGLISIFLFYALLYVVFEERKILDFKTILRIYALGLIVSCALGLLRNVSPLLSEVLPAVYSDQQIRFQGLMAHPNSLAQLIVLPIYSLLILKYINKISLREFWLLFIPLFAFGYLTLSRGFILIMAIALAIFSLLYLVKHKAQALPLICLLLVTVSLTSVVFLGETKVYLQRVDDTIIDSPKGDNTDSDNDLLAGKSEEWIQGVFAGEILFDPGRAGLRKLYMMDWSSSTQTILFGRGISRPFIGQMSAHNLFIQELWKHGIVGYLFYAAMILCALNWKKLKQITQYLPLLILLVPYFISALIEEHLLDYSSITIMLMAIGFLEKLSAQSENPPD